MPDETVRTIMPFDSHRSQTTTADGLTTGWVSPSKIEPSETVWKPGIPGYLGEAPSAAAEIFRLRRQLGEEFRRRLAAEQLVDALEDFIRLTDPLQQRRMQRKARIAVVTAKAAWETTIRGPEDEQPHGESGR